MYNNSQKWNNRGKNLDLDKPIKQMNVKEKKAYFEQLADENVINEMDRHKEQMAVRKFNKKL